MSYYVETCAGLGNEVTHIRFEENGRITVLVGVTKPAMPRSSPTNSMSI
jgi:hypothetical protein